MQYQNGAEYAGGKYPHYSSSGGGDYRSGESVNARDAGTGNRHHNLSSVYPNHDLDRVAGGYANGGGGGTIANLYPTAYRNSHVERSASYDRDDATSVATMPGGDRFVPGIPEGECQYLFKFIIVGDEGVGKTCLLLQFTDHR